MNVNYEAQQLITKYNELAKVNELLKPFCDETTAVIKALLEELGSHEKEKMFLDSEVQVMKKQLLQLKKRSAMLSAWFGPDVVRAMDLAADITEERFKK